MQAIEGMEPEAIVRFVVGFAILTGVLVLQIREWAERMARRTVDNRDSAPHVAPVEPQWPIEPCPAPWGPPEACEPTEAEEEPEEEETCADLMDLDMVEWEGFPWFDDRACWGCDMGCTRRGFVPFAGQNIGAEIRGAGAARARVEADGPYHSGFAPRSRGRGGSTVDDLWEQSCERCGRLARRVAAGLEPVRESAVVVGSGAAMECPF